MIRKIGNVVESNRLHSITICSEQDAFNVLGDLLHGNITPEEINLSSAKSWLFFHLKLEGDEFHSSLNVSNMAALIEYQKAIYRMAAFSLGVVDARGIPKDLKDSLTIQFEIKEGCSGVDIPRLAEIISTFFEKVFAEMTPFEATLCVIVLMLSLSGYFGWAVYLKQKSKIKLKEIEAEADFLKNDTLNNFIKLVEKQNNNFAESNRAIIALATDRSETARVIKSEASKADDAILKGASGVARLSFKGQQVSADVLDLLNTNSKSDIIWEDKQGEFYLESSKAQFKEDKAFSFSVKHFNCLICNVEMPDYLEEDQKQVIWHAYERKKSIWLALKVKKVGNEYKGGIILGAKGLA